MTRLCAEAAGLGYLRDCAELPNAVEYNADPMESAWMIYDPLNDDRQAMALAKTFQLAISPCGGDNYRVTAFQQDAERELVSVSIAHSGKVKGLSRAIVRCVAELERRKRGSV